MYICILKKSFQSRIYSLFHNSLPLKTKKTSTFLQWSLCEPGEILRCANLVRKNDSHKISIRGLTIRSFLPDSGLIFSWIKKNTFVEQNYSQNDLKKILNISDILNTFAVSFCIFLTIYFLLLTYYFDTYALISINYY